MKTVSEPDVLDSLVRRLRRITPDTPRRWGRMTAHEMLCHLGDAAEMALRTRPRVKPVPIRHRPLFKTLMLWTPMRGPRGVPTNPQFDPNADGTKPTAFEKDRERAIAALERLAAARGDLEPVHGILGTMSVRDWQRWAWKHTDHHLRQFGR